ncbi:MAG: hypothetical protein ACNYPI_00570 [Arenicellales bacterium WSBS_2016_MAG_OTU3]
MEHIETVVIGARRRGACARSWHAGQRVLVLEQAGVSGTEAITQWRSYPRRYLTSTDSRRKRFVNCGNKKLYAFCDEYNVACKRCGKLIVASGDSQNENLQQLNKTTSKIMYTTCALLIQTNSRNWNPSLVALVRYYRPLPGIIDSHAYMLALQGDLESLEWHDCFPTAQWKNLTALRQACA